MARSRNIKPGFFTNEQLADCGPLAHLLFAGLWCHCDREGRCSDSPRALKAKILPFYRCDVHRLLATLEAHGFIVRYAVEGSQYIQVLNFTRHQNPHRREPPSLIPPWPGMVPGPGRAPGAPGTGPADSPSLIPDSPSPPTPSASSSGRSSRPRNAEEGEEVVSLEGDWIGLEKPLRACGVMESAPALAEARKQGCTPAEVGMLISHFEAHPNAWTPGYLYARIMRLRPGDDPSKGWPEPSHEWRKAQEAQLPPKPLTPTREELIAENQRVIEALEAEVGPALDGLPPDRLEKFAAHTFQGNVMMQDRYRRNPKDKLCREWLLRGLKACRAPRVEVQP